MPKQKSPFAFLKILLVLAIVVLIVGGGIAASLWAAGVPMEKIAFWRTEQKRVASINLPMNWQPISAYAKVARNDLIDPRTGQIPSIDIPLTSLVGMSATVSGPDGQLVDQAIQKAEQTE
ncbi:MAG: hypothetical protein GY924_28055, partial [Planctomycetaceae bacterium]|nr:hypothetical protein [Planctomycetaceae bacterium]